MLAAYTAEICFDVVVNASSPALAVGPMLRVFRKICVFDAAWLQRMRYLLHAPVKSISFHRNVTYGCLRHRSKGIQSVGSGLLWVGDRVLNLIRNGFDAFTSLCLALDLYNLRCSCMDLSTVSCIIPLKSHSPQSKRTTTMKEKPIGPTFYCHICALRALNNMHQPQSIIRCHLSLFSFVPYFISTANSFSPLESTPAY